MYIIRKDANIIKMKKLKGQKENIRQKNKLDFLCLRSSENNNQTPPKQQEHIKRRPKTLKLLLAQIFDRIFEPCR